MRGIAAFLCWTMIIASAAGFFLSLAEKWGILEWMQVHAPCELFWRLVSCRFCLSFWAGAIVSLIICIITGEWWLMLCPVCSTLYTRELWQ